jgi:hypothetical protein
MRFGVYSFFDKYFVALYLIFLIKIGAGEGVRTLDPNLGKVVLYH